jgi:hypothetical protein
MVLDTGSVLIAIFPVEVAATSLYFWILPVVAVVGLMIGGGKTVYSLTKQRADEKAERRKYSTLQVRLSTSSLFATRVSNGMTRILMTCSLPLRRRG